MKKNCVILAALCLFLALTSCAFGDNGNTEPMVRDTTLSDCVSGENGNTEPTVWDTAFFDVLEDSEQELFESFSKNPPISMTVRYDQVYPDAIVEDAALITELYGAITKMRVSGKTNMSVTDAYNSVVFKCADGTTYGLNFEHHILCVGSDNYELTNDEDFWKLFAQIAEDCYEQSQQDE